MDGNFFANLLQSLGQMPGNVTGITGGAMSPPAAPPWPTPWLDPAQGGGVAPARQPLTAANLGIENLPDPSPQQPPVNVMQGAVPAGDAGTPPALPDAAPKIATPEKRTRHSLLDTVGRVADAFARFGGADPGYQSTFDREDAAKRATVLAGQHDTLAGQQIEAGTDAATARNNALVGNAVRGLQSIRRANPNADLNTIWPLLAHQAGIPDDQAARLSQIFASHPEAIDGMSALINGHQEYNGNVVYARDAAGHIAAFQPSNSNASEARNILPTGFEPIDPVTFVNTGNAQVGVGRNSAVPRVVLPVAEAPGRAADRSERRYESDTGHATTITVAGMPARATGQGAATAANRQTAYREARTGLTELSQQIDTIINDPQIMHGTGMIGAIERHIPGTPAQRLQGNIDTARGQALAAAINHLKALSAGGNLGFRLTQQEAIAFGNSMAGALGNTSQSAADYAANLRAAQGRIHAMIARMDEDAQRQPPAPARPRTPATVQPRGNSGVPAVGAVRQGYRFKGGNPASPTSWERVQ